MFEKIIRVTLSTYTVLEKVGDKKWKSIPNKQNSMIDHTEHELSDSEVLSLMIDNLIIKGINSIETEQVVSTTYYMTQVYGERY